tara:strand:+ start:709 stop:828 length:120 start_codon:yes stop_codon:yes gene_type:complete
MYIKPNNNMTDPIDFDNGSTKLINNDMKLNITIPKIGIS